MNVKLHLSGGLVLTAKVPYEGCEHVIAETKCPECGAAPLKVRGVHSHRVSDRNDAVEGRAQTLCCREDVGRILVTVDTLFGLEEDERVLNGPWRVY